MPSFGPNGMLVVMGGLTKNDVAGLADFGIVSIYDPVKRETGNKPAPREQFLHSRHQLRRTTVMKYELGILVFPFMGSSAYMDFVALSMPVGELS